MGMPWPQMQKCWTLKCFASSLKSDDAEIGLDVADLIQAAAFAGWHFNGLTIGIRRCPRDISEVLESKNIRITWMRLDSGYRIIDSFCCKRIEVMWIQFVLRLSENFPMPRLEQHRRFNILVTSPATTDLARCCKCLLAAMGANQMLIEA